MNLNPSFQGYTNYGSVLIGNKMELIHGPTLNHSFS
jgi:hypothetical protein